MRVSGRIEYKKILGEMNPADLLTKHLGADVIKRHLNTMNAAITEGRAESAPEISSVLEEDPKSHARAWIRSMPIRKVHFDENVLIRPIPATGAGRSCSEAE